MQTPSWLLRAMPVFQKNRHHGMKGLYSVLLLTFLLSTAYCDDSQSVNDSANFVTETDITDIDVQGKYDTETTNYTLSETTSGRNVFQTNDFVSEAVTAAFTSSFIEKEKIETANKASTITYPLTQTTVNTDDRITAMYTSNSRQTKKQENEYSSMTPPITIPADTCDTDQVEVTNSSVLVNAFTNETNCSLLVTAPINASISVKLLRSSLNNVTSHFYIENIGKLPPKCPDRYVKMAIDFTPCIMMIRGGEFKFNFQNTGITLEMRTKNVQTLQCFEMQTNALEGLLCNSKSYATNVEEKIETFHYHNMIYKGDYPSCRRGWGWITRIQRMRVIRYLARCACDCSDNCVCTLGHREWLSTCTDGKDSTTTHADFIVYNQTMSGLSFANTGMNEIKQHAFLGFVMLEILILEHNSLAVLPATICQHLPQLKVLKMGYNLLSNLTCDLFKGQCEHKLREIHLNNNKLNYLERDLFNSASNLNLIDLSQNRLAHIPKDTFRTLTELFMLRLDGNRISNLDMLVGALQKLTNLKLNDNHILVLPFDVFDSLGLLRSFDLSDNHISVLPEGVFDSLHCLNHLKLGGNYISVLPIRPFEYSLSRFTLLVLDMSDNQISVLPAGVFDPLVMLVSLDLSSNYISVLPTGVFDLVGRSSNSRHNLRTLRLHTNNISTLHVNVFKLLKKLHTLDVSHNVIHNLPIDVFKALTQLKTLDLSHNAVEQIPSNLLTSQENLLTLDLSCNTITTLYVNVFKSLRRLYVLDMSYNVLQEVLSDVFQSLTGLKALDLSHNTIEVIPTQLFTALGNLLTLDLSSNSLSNLQPESFLALKNLTVLNLCCNNLTTIASKTLETLSALDVLYLSKNKITEFLESLFLSTTNLRSLEVSENHLKSIPFQCFENLNLLIYLNLSTNSLTSLPSFNAQRQLQVLDLSENRLARLISGTFKNLGNLSFLSLHKNELIALSGGIFYHLNNLLFLNASYNAIQQIEPMVFSRNSKLQTFDMRGNEMSKVTYDSFTDPQHATIMVDKYAGCCFMDEVQCIALKPRPEFLTCNRMLRNVFLRISVWIFGLSAFICNGIAYFVRSRKREANKVQTILISHLALSDLLMGVNMLILASADVYYGGHFPSHVDTWRQSFSCKLAGFLSIFSSEGSVFFIALISIDRMLGIKYPLGGGLRLTTKWARIFVALAWLTAFLISIIPIGLATDNGNVFSISEVCIGIPIVRRHVSTYRSESEQINVTFTKTTYEYKNIRHNDILSTITSRYLSGVKVELQKSVQNISYDVADITGSQIAPIFSIVVFIGANLTCFFIVAFCYMYIFIKANKTSGGAGRTLDRDEQVRMAKKMFAIVFTDFCCWVPLGFICILTQCSVLEISPEMYAWTVGFILPINSSINPFLYVLYEAIADHRRKKQEQRNERKNIEMQVRWRSITHFGLKFDQQW